MKHAAAGEGRASIPRRATREEGSSRDGSLRAALQTPPNSPVLSPPSTAGREPSNCHLQSRSPSCPAPRRRLTSASASRYVTLLRGGRDFLPTPGNRKELFPAGRRVQLLSGSDPGGPGAVVA